MGARSRSTSFAGPYTREDGFLGYNEICEVIRFPFWISILKHKHTIFLGYVLKYIDYILGTNIGRHSMEGCLGWGYNGTIYA